VAQETKIGFKFRMGFLVVFGWVYVKKPGDFFGCVPGCLNTGYEK